MSIVYLTIMKKFIIAIIIIIFGIINVESLEKNSSKKLNDLIDEGYDIIYVTSMNDFLYYTLKRATPILMVKDSVGVIQKSNFEVMICKINENYEYCWKP